MRRLSVTNLGARTASYLDVTARPRGYRAMYARHTITPSQFAAAERLEQLFESQVNPLQAFDYSNERVGGSRKPSSGTTDRALEARKQIAEVHADIGDLPFQIAVWLVADGLGVEDVWAKLKGLTANDNPKPWSQLPAVRAEVKHTLSKLAEHFGTKGTSGGVRAEAGERSELQTVLTPVGRCDHMTEDEAVAYTNAVADSLKAMVPRKPD